MNFVGQEWICWDTYVSFLEVEATPVTPEADQLRLYAKDKSGVSALYYLDDAGVEHDFSAVGPLVSGTGVANRLAYWTSASVLAANAALTLNHILVADSNGLPTGNASAQITNLAGNVNLALKGTTDGSIFLDGSATGNPYIEWKQASVFKARMQYLDADDSLAISVNGAERFRFGSAGQLGIGGATYGGSGDIFSSGGASAAPTWVTRATLNAALDHGTLAGLGDDDHAQYALLAGRLGTNAFTGTISTTGNISAGIATATGSFARMIQIHDTTAGGNAALELSQPSKKYGLSIVNTQFRLIDETRGANAFVITTTGLMGIGGVDYNTSPPPWMFTLAGTSPATFFGWTFNATAASRNWGFNIDIDQFGGWSLFTSSAKTTGLLDITRLFASKNGNIGINSVAEPSTGTGGLFFADGTALATMAANTAGFYADDIAGNVSMHAINENGDVIKLIKTNTYTQTFATADRTFSAYTSDPEGSAYTGIDNLQLGTPYAQLADLNALRVAYETLRVHAEDIGQLVNGLIDDFQNIGMVG